MTNTWAGPALLLALALLSCGAQARTDGEQAVGNVGDRLRANDCAGATKALNAGLAAGYPEAALLAGTMFEEGFCVKKDWNKAVGFYSQASDGGIKEAQFRLAAGFAAAEHGPDKAAALWWARQAGLDADRCTAQLPKTEDPDQFVQQLGKWPAHELEVCNYVVGVLSFIHADIRYPITGVAREVAGRTEGDYRPATLYFHSTDFVDGTNSARQGMATVIAHAMALAKERYPKPSGIDPAWVIPFAFVVDTDKSRWW